MGGGEVRRRALALGEDETIARPAVGVRRFKPPDEFNFPRIFKSLAAGSGPYAERAMDALCGTFERRGLGFPTNGGRAWRPGSGFCGGLGSSGLGGRSVGKTNRNP